MEKDLAYYEEHPDKITPEVVDKLLAAEDEPDGDASEGGDTASAAPGADASAVGKPEEPAILAKDGKHMIPYSELEAARDEANRLKAELKALKEKLEAQDDVNLAEEYPDLGEKLERKLKAAEERLAAKIEQVRHLEAIRAAHPDANEIVASGALKKWIDSLPMLQRKSAELIYEGGTTAEVIELLNEYKKAAQPAAKKPQPKAAAEAPYSLSDLPASAGNADNDVLSLVERGFNPFVGKTPEQIRELLNRYL